LEEGQKEECTSVAAYLVGTGPSSVPRDYDHVFRKDSMGDLGDKL